MTLARTAFMMLYAFAAPMSLGLEPKDQIAREFTEDITQNLSRATTVVICDFDPAKGHIITQVIKGNHAATGSLWNDALFPKYSLLVFERMNDTIGNYGGPISIAGCYRLDHTKKFIILESCTDLLDTSTRSEFLIPIDDILKSIQSDR